MKKTFLIVGVMGAILSTNGYADIVISQADENPDMTITVARATKTKARVTPQTTDTSVTSENEDLWVDLDFLSGSNSDVGEMHCPQGCKLKCHRYKNAWQGDTIRCTCKGEFGRPCDIVKSVVEAEDLK